MATPKEISAPINLGNQGSGNINIGTVANGVYFPSLTNSKVLQLDGTGRTFSGNVAVSAGGTGSTSFTDNTIIFSSGGVLTSAPSLTNGQLLIGSTGVLPVASTLTAGAGISIAVGAGSITISSTVTPVTSVSAGTGITLTGTATDPIVNLSTPVAISSGGTNSITALNNNRIMISSGGSIVEGSALTNGQLLIGSTGSTPVATTLTAGAGISIAVGAGSITITNTSAGGGVTTVGANVAATTNSASITGTTINMAIANYDSTGVLFGKTSGTQTSLGTSKSGSILNTSIVVGDNIFSPAIVFPVNHTIAIGNNLCPSLVPTFGNSTYIGCSSLPLLTTDGIGNTIIGSDLLPGATSIGSANTMIGRQIGSLMISPAIGSVNTIIGGSCGAPSGNSNCLFGNNSGQHMSSADSCVCIGSASGIDITTASGVVCLGYSSGQGVTTGINSIYLGTGTTGTPGAGFEYVFGTSLTGNGSFTYTFDIGSIPVDVDTALTINTVTGKLTRVVSSKRYKNPLPDPLLSQFTTKLFELIPRAYTLKNDPTNTPRVGYYAEEVEEIVGPLGNPIFKPLLRYTNIDDLDKPNGTKIVKNWDDIHSQWVETTVTTYEQKNAVESINYAGFVVPLIELCKQQQAQIDSMLSRIAILEAR